MEYFDRSIFFVLIFTGSYVFIWQPFYGFDITDDNYILLKDGLIVDDENSYLVKAK